MKRVSVQNLSRALKQKVIADYCDRFWDKFRGLMFRRELAPDRGLVLAEASESRTNAGIHMLGMAFDLTIVWTDSAYRVVDVRGARRWRSFLLPRNPARYVIELHVSRFEDFRIGDQLLFEETPAA
jgi:uncharacterized membrane protein (UPF0127 family)